MSNGQEQAEQADKVRAVIRHCIMGTNEYHSHKLFPGYHYTDAVKEIAEAAGAYWLIEAILSHQVNPKVQLEAFQCWRLELDGKGGAVLRCTDGGKQGKQEAEITRQVIEFTDYPCPEGVTLWLMDDVLLHPNEH